MVASGLTMRKMNKTAAVSKCLQNGTALLVLLFTAACGTQEKKAEETKSYVTAPAFNADSAFYFLKKQVDMGPRNPGSAAHAQCVQFIKSTLARYSWQIIEQNGPAQTYDGKRFTIRNIIATWKPELNNRILLLAHYDCRPIADEDSSRTQQAILGANDGASGVAALLEIARQLANSNAALGVDLLFSDLEDYGQPSTDTQNKANSWCLGTQYWAKNPHVQGYTANYGILLDMVGGKNPNFPKEGTGMRFAPDIVQKVWSTASRLGYGNIFNNQEMGETTDDHAYVNAIAKIPCIDIVHMESTTGTYPAYHHTHRDNMEIIDPNTLKMVGDVVLNTIYN